MNKLQEIEDVNCSGKCREESCSRPRVAFSVFCEEHSAAELTRARLAAQERAGKKNGIVSDPYCAFLRLSKVRRMGAVSDGEYRCGVLEWLITAYAVGEMRPWEEILGNLAPEGKELLVEMIRRLDVPWRMHNSVPERTAEDRDRISLEAQEELMKRLGG